MQIETERLYFYFDFADPVAYAISTQLEGWTRSIGIGVHWVALPSAERSGRIPEAQAKVGQALANAYAYPLFPRFETNSRPACRILALTGSADRAQLTMRLFQAW